MEKKIETIKDDLFEELSPEKMSSIVGGAQDKGLSLTHITVTDVDGTDAGDIDK